jgi:uncharacterized protein (TIGR03435 family)
MTRTIAGTMLALAAGCRAYSQAADAPVAFEVASIKPAPPPGRGLVQIGCSGGPGSRDPGLYTCFNSDISQLVVQAYGLRRYQLPSFPSGGDSAEFNITAKVPPGATEEQLKGMLQNLLAERFKLTFHYEKKEMQVYDLVVAKGGLKMKESPPEPPPAPPDGNTEKTAPPPAPVTRMARDADGFLILPTRRGGSSTVFSRGRLRMRSSAVTMKQLVGALTGQVGRPVTDATGLTGKYDFTLTWGPDGMGAIGTRGASAAMPAPAEGGAVAIVPDSDPAPTIFAAIQEQLGLRLEQKKGTVDMFIIDHVEKTPTEN